MIMNVEIAYEENVIGSIVMNPENSEFVFANLDRSDFSDPNAKALFSLLLEMRAKQVPIDDMGVLMKQIRAKQIDLSAHDVALFFTGSKGMPFNCRFYVSQVIRDSAKRKAVMGELHPGLEQTTTAIAAPPWPG